MKNTIKRVLCVIVCAVCFISAIAIPSLADSYTDYPTDNAGIYRALSMFNQISFEVGQGEDVDKYVVTTDKRSGMFGNSTAVNVYTDLFHYAPDGSVDVENIENYLNMTTTAGYIRQGFITTWLRQRTRNTYNSFRTYYDHMYVAQNSINDGITFQAYDDGKSSKVQYDVTVYGEIVTHNNYDGENKKTPFSLTKRITADRGDVVNYRFNAEDIYDAINLAPEARTEYAHLTNVVMYLGASSSEIFEMRNFLVYNEYKSMLDVNNIIDAITEYENSGSVLDSIALDKLLEAVVNLLKVEIFPNVSFWLIMTAILGVLLLVWFVKLFAGG